jgi:hypothetical protein
MAIREIDPETGMPFEAEGTGMGISSGDDDRREETAEEMEERIRREIMGAVATPAEPKRETREEMEARIRRELLAKADAERVAEQGEGGAKPLSEQAAVKRGPGRPRKTDQEPAATTVPADPGTALQAADGGAGVAVETALAILFERNAGKGLNFEERDLTIPRLNLLQDGSPQCKERLPEYIEGARPGLWLNTVTRELLSAALIVPVSYKRRYVGWFPRAENGSGGGLARMDVPEAEYKTYEETGIGVRSYMSDVEVRTGNKSQTVQKLVDVVETPEWVVLLLDPHGKARPQPCAISFPRTKAQAAAQMNTIIMMQVEIGSDGKEYELPSFANVFRIASVSTGEGSESYFIPTVEHMGRVTRLDIAERASKLHDQFSAGRVKVVEDAQA